MQAEHYRVMKAEKATLAARRQSGASSCLMPYRIKWKRRRKFEGDDETGKQREMITQSENSSKNIIGWA